MRVKHIQIQGFKSFADRVYIELHPGTTAIVGPNGSGKSNILDAIRWCLGEQSYRILRGYSMEEVIFAGTDNRKPAGSAEVSIVFELDDPYLIEKNNGNRELKIARVLYRTGESEYLLNDKVVRLKDITEFLMDAGLTSRSFSIIAQGEISEVATASPEDLRKYLDEAAGISRYRKRREETLRRMEKTKENLERVEDVLKELIRQRNSLKRQVNKAARFEKLQMQRRALLKVKFTRDVKWLEKEIAELKEKLREKNISASSVREELLALDSRYAQLSGSLSRISTDLEAFTVQAGEKRETIEKLQEKISGGRERLGNIDVEIATLTERLNSTVTIRKKAHEEMSERERRIKELEEMLSAAENIYKDAVEEYEKVSQTLKDVKNQVEKEREEYFSFNQGIAELGNKISQLEELSERIQVQLKREIESEREAREELKEKEELFKRLEDSVEEREKEIAHLSLKYTQFKNRQKEVEKERESLKGDLARVESTISSLKTKLETLRQFYHEVIEEIEFDGRKRLGEHLTPKEGYEKALGAALGTLVRWTLIENEEALVEAIGKVDRKNLTKTGFILTNGTSPQSDVPELPNELMFLTDVVEISDERVKHILKKYIIAPSVEKAIYYSRHKWAENFEFVTPTGERVFMGSVVEITGDRDEIVRFFVTAEEIRKAESELEDTEKERTLLQQKIEKVEAEEKELLEEISKVENDLGKLQRVVETLKEEKSRLSFEISGINQKIERHSLRTRELESEVERIKEEQKKLEEERKKLQKTVEEKRKKLEELSSKLAAAESEEEKCRRKIEDARVRYESIKSSLKSLEENVESLRTDVTRSEREEREIKEKLSTLLEEKERLESEIEQFEKELEEIRAEHHKLQLEISTLNQREREITREMEAVHREIESRRSIYDEIISEAHSIEVTLAEKNKEFDHLKKELENLGDVEEELIKWAEEMDEEELSMTLSQIETSIQKMGAINFSAKEEYEEVAKRVEFIEKQKQDLLSSLDDLQDALHTIDEECSKRVAETIEVVNARFRDVISKLFDGADGNVSLVDPSDPINSGVSIKVRPPGKRVKHLGLLSGGERAIVSFAFLFSLSSTARNPLFIFDEVDAPLDDTNIGKFLALLDEIKEKSQIIIITHNKKTIKHADYVYGVTMEEKGVSKIFSLAMEG